MCVCGAGGSGGGRGQGKKKGGPNLKRISKSDEVLWKESSTTIKYALGKLSRVYIYIYIFVVDGGNLKVMSDREGEERERKKKNRAWGQEGIKIPRILIGFFFKTQ